MQLKFLLIGLATTATAMPSPDSHRSTVEARDNSMPAPPAVSADAPILETRALKRWNASGGCKTDWGGRCLDTSFPLEISSASALDRRHRGRFPMGRGDDYVFHAGEVCGHNVITSTLPAGQGYGTGSAAALASQVEKFFPNLWFGLLVGVAADLPNPGRIHPRDIRLGDVLVTVREGESAGLVAYDLGKEMGRDGFRLLRSRHVLATIEAVVRSAIGDIKLSAPNYADIFLPYYESVKDKEHTTSTFADPSLNRDKLYETDKHGAKKEVKRPRRPESKRTRVWYSPIGSGDKLMKDARTRDGVQTRLLLFRHIQVKKRSLI
ncbi:hypothetical protein DL770_006614 [Monosporascus sp. CRB-9-2]|nr:hypothetical protein DL770_006614 [Monosporascus sp. CRB-9-2]